MTEPIVLHGRQARAVIAPRLGGRILQFSSHGRDWLWENPLLLDREHRLRVDPTRGEQATTIAEWFNYGGDKSWPAPQASAATDGWVGPPDPVLDAGAYEVVGIEGRPPLTVRMRSALDPRTRLRIDRTVHLDPIDPVLTTATRLTNCADRPATWAAWSITQVAARLGGHVEVQVDPEGPDAIDLGLVDGPPLITDREGDTVRIAIQDTVGKIGFPAAIGDLAYCDADGSWLRQRFRVQVGAAYPDSGSRAQLWMQYPTATPLATLSNWQPSGRLIELECLSPLTELRPGQSVELRVEWRAWAPTD